MLVVVTEHCEKLWQKNDVLPNFLKKPVIKNNTELFYNLYTGAINKENTLSIVVSDKK